MPTRRFVPLVLGVSALAGVLVLAVPAAAARQAPPSPGGPEAGPPARGPRGPRGESMSVEGAMKTMDRALDRLESLVGDPAKKAEALAAVGEAERGCIAAKNQPVPRDILEHAADDAARTAMATEYRRDLLQVMRGLLDAEEAIMAGQADRARESLLRVSEIQKKSHERFGVKED